MTDHPRLIEFAFPLKQASLDSVHEKNVRHGHISTLHIWPARRPLAACRAALIATLLPDPSAQPKPAGMSDEDWQKEIVRRRQALCEKIGGRVATRIERKKMPDGQAVEREKAETEGGILHWGRETENSETVDWFRQEIRKAYGGRPPHVLDPFAGGGAIPLEAMRLGCEATAIDVNPVAWFILKCTLEYPQKLAGHKRPLPAFIVKNGPFMEAFFKAQGHSKAETRTLLKKLGVAMKENQQAFDFQKVRDVNIDAELAWHIRAWGQWVLERARSELAKFYPVYADFEPVEKNVYSKSYERQPMRLVPLINGASDVDALNAEFSEEYLSIKRNPRWVAKPTVAYLWARTVTCKNCRATTPLLKTRWLSKKDGKRALLTVEPNRDKTGVVFGIENNVPVKGGNAAQRREHDKRLAAGTMSRAGAKCPCCGIITTMEDIKLEAQATRLHQCQVAVVVSTGDGYKFRSVTEGDIAAWDASEAALKEVTSFDYVGKLDETIDPRRPSPNARGLSGLTRFGITTFSKVFNSRQQIALYSIARLVRSLSPVVSEEYVDAVWIDGIVDPLVLLLGKIADYNSEFCTWNIGRQSFRDTFARFALPMTTDYAESNPIGDMSGGIASALGYISECVKALSLRRTECSHVLLGSSDTVECAECDVVVTDPPYYDAIPYGDISDFFYVWLRRGVAQRYAREFASPLVEKDKEIIQHAGRMDGDNVAARRHYELGMSRVFARCWKLLRPNGRMVVVFAHKHPGAWEALVGSMIQEGYVVTASWPIMTERQGKTAGGARLASSVWLVCRKRAATARAGWDNKVLEDMRAIIGGRLWEFWDAGIRGPDFVWAATGPALEAYSKHPVVKMANEPNSTLSVTEFLNHARRMVVDFVVGRVLSADEDNGAMAAADRLDEPTAYYLLHRKDFNLDEAPVGACILYATACGLSDQELVRDWDLLAKTDGDETAAVDDEDEESEGDDEPIEETRSGSKVKLKAWNQRRGRSLGYEAPGGRLVPLIDRIHRLMHLWKDGDVHRVDEYLDEHGLRRHELFRRVLQSLIELAKAGSEERSLLESLSNHIGAKGAKKKDAQRVLALGDDE